MFPMEKRDTTGLALNGDIDAKKEYSYIHLQKRAMDCSSIPTGDFMIVPNQFEECREISEDDIRQFASSDSEYEMLKAREFKRNQFQNIIDGALFFRIKKAYDRIRESLL